MAWVEFHEELVDHPKTWKMASLLYGQDSVKERAAVAASLATFWARWGLKFAGEEGVIPKGTPPGILAKAGLWEGEPGVYFKAMALSGWLDMRPDGSCRIHDWKKHSHAYFSNKDHWDRVRDGNRKRKARERLLKRIKLGEVAVGDLTAEQIDLLGKENVTRDADDVTRDVTLLGVTSPPLPELSHADVTRDAAVAEFLNEPITQNNAELESSHALVTRDQPVTSRDSHAAHLTIPNLTKDKDKGVSPGGGPPPGSLFFGQEPTATDKPVEKRRPKNAGVRGLVGYYKDKLREHCGEAIAKLMAGSTAAGIFMTQTKAGFEEEDIRRRIDHWFRSQHPKAVDTKFSIKMFFTFFPDLDKGPVGKPGERRQDGYSTASGDKYGKIKGGAYDEYVDILGEPKPGGTRGAG